jgi:hypothetical protein
LIPIVPLCCQPTFFHTQVTILVVRSAGTVCHATIGIGLSVSVVVVSHEFIVCDHEICDQEAFVGSFTGCHAFGTHAETRMIVNTIILNQKIFFIDKKYKIKKKKLSVTLMERLYCLYSSNASEYDEFLDEDIMNLFLFCSW